MQVAAFTQFMSADRIAAIVYDGADPGDDPRWRLSGARTREEYARWCRHACGMACLRMILHHRDGHAPPLLDLVHGCRAYGGYREEPGGIKGLYYAPFADYVAAEHGLAAEVHPILAPQELAGLAAGGRMVIASVHPEIRRPDRPAPGRGGHLVLVTGAAGGAVTFNNPSGHTEQARRATLPLEVFSAFFAGRGISVRAGSGRA
ncbi:peptidase [Nonomuraea typhae]|uniref:peptidase n=1 Tax=Nonomuraea typhae TaxID=2603600 RepID=UPI0012FAC0C5|nr:peptidase [Nonomuraea typhae]